MKTLNQYIYIYVVFERGPDMYGAQIKMFLTLAPGSDTCYPIIAL